MYLVVKAKTDKQRNEDIQSKETSPHIPHATQREHTLFYDVCQQRHFVSGVNLSVSYVTTQEEGVDINARTDLYAVSGDGLTVAFLDVESTVTPLYTNPMYAAKVNAVRAKVNALKCRIFTHKDSDESYTKRRTIEMKSLNYKKIVLSNDGEFLFALALTSTKTDIDTIEIYRRQANTYKHLRSFNWLDSVLRSCVRKTLEGNFTDVHISNIAVMDDHLGMVLQYTYVDSDKNTLETWTTQQLVTTPLVDVIDPSIWTRHYEPVNYRTSNGSGSIAYEFVCDCAICYVTEFDSIYRVSQIYVLSKDLCVIHSLSMEYLLKQIMRVVTLAIPPYGCVLKLHHITLNI